MKKLIVFALCACAGWATTYPTGWSYLSGTTFTGSSAIPANGFGGSTCPSFVSGSPNCGSTGGAVLFQTYAPNMTNNQWSGGVYDRQNNRLLWWGGGHNDYFGNEVYSLSLTGTPAITRLTDPTVPINNGTSCPQEAQYDGNPMARHTYDGLADMGGTGYFFVFNGALWPCGGHAAGTWVLNTNTTPPTWISPTIAGANAPSGGTEEWAEAVWDEAGSRGILVAFGNIWSFTWNAGTSTITYTRLHASASMNVYQPTCDIDPIMRTPIGGSRGRWMVCMESQYSASPPGTFRIMAVDVSGNDATYTPQNWTSAASGSCTALQGTSGNQGGPGFAYSSALGMFVGLPVNGGNTVYAYSAVTRVCVPYTYPNGPSGSVNGIFGRWRYVKSGDYFVGIADPTQTAFVLNLGAPTPGLGSSTYTCVDVDGDGYGTGAGCTGADAYDFDAAVHTAAQAVSSYGSLHATYGKMGYTPTRYWVVDSVNGNNGTGASCTTANFNGTYTGSDCRPFLNWSGVSGSVTAGDAVVFRVGTYSYSVTPESGSSSAPVHYLAYPGERPLFSGNSHYWWLVDAHYIVLDGVKINLSGDVSSACIYGGTSDSLSSSAFHDVVIRHVEATSCTNGPYAFNGLENILIEYNAFHDMTTSHAVYLGSRAMVSRNVSVRRNLLYGASRCGVQFNGRVSDLRIEQNIMYHNAYPDGGADVCLEEGVHDSFVRGNALIGSRKGIAMSTYNGKEGDNACGSGGSDLCSCSPINQGGICAYNQYNIVFSNNTIINPGLDVAGNDITSFPMIEIGRQSGCTTAICLATYFPNNTWQNTVMHATSNTAPPLTFTGGATSPASGPTNVVNGAIFLSSFDFLGYGLSGGGGYSKYTCAQAPTYLSSVAGCSNTDPLFTALGAYNDISGYDLRLASGSTAKTGAVSVGALPYDLIGNPISLGSLGAYEFQGAVCAITPTSAGPYTAGQSASRAFTATGCSSSSWSTTGLSSSGLSINSSTGVLAGTAVAGTYSAHILYDTADQPITIIVNAAPSISSSGTLTAGTQGSPYTLALSTSGGTGSLTCAVVTGSLPTSLSFSACTITGTPTVANTYTFTAHATDGNSITGSTSSSMSITIAASGGGGSGGVKKGGKSVGGGKIRR